MVTIISYYIAILIDNVIYLHSNGAAAWIGYYRLLPDTIGYFLYSYKIYELPSGKNVWNNGKFYGDTKI